MSKANEASRVKVLFPDEAKAFIDNREEGTYTLLDVRQPFEYENEHLPGAKLVPLPRLVDSMDELDRRQATLVYCATGGRSMMAARLLSNQGFGEVYQIQGGIDAWEAPTASGPVALHLRFVKGDEPPQEVISIAYQMEEGLRKFHQEIESRTLDADLRDLLNRLIKAEESHKRTLLELLGTVSKGHQERNPVLPSQPVSEASLIEGGVDIAEFVHQNERYLQTVSGYLELAMMIEAQALDLYLRMANASTNQITKGVLFRIGEEEKVHLTMLGHYLESQSQSTPE